MIKIEYEIYRNDYWRKNDTKTFENLASLKKWIFNQMERPYSDSYAMYFPDYRKKTVTPSAIEFQPSFGGHQIWIHLISTEDGIIFSDGKLTSGQKHWNKEIKLWLVECNEYKQKPVFNFV